MYARTLLFKTAKTGLIFMSYDIQCCFSYKQNSRWKICPHRLADEGISENITEMVQSEKYIICLGGQHIPSRS